MKKIGIFLVNHLKEDFKAGHYLTVALILAVAISANYYIEFEDTVLSSFRGFKKFASYFVMYTCLFGITVLSYVTYYKRREILKNGRFWGFAIFGLLILGLDSSAPYVMPIAGKLPFSLFLWGYKVIINAQSLIVVLLPIILFYRLFENKSKEMYGLNHKQFDARPYLLLIALMCPFIIGASFFQSFLNQYPMYKETSASEYLGVGEWVTISIYEIVYGLDFVTVEFLFRGFFVLGLSQFLGRSSVLVMAVIYCSLHFGKPMGEAISSIFGGYVLGVIALETRSIWGGVIVHLGIAWMMELAAFLQKL
jgi:hypothetical protein